MLPLTSAQVKEISEELEIGNKCFYDRTTGKLTFKLDLEDEWHQAILGFPAPERPEKDSDNLIEIEKPCSADSFRIMEAFAAQLPDNIMLKEKLIAALVNKKPFSKFKMIIESDGLHTEKWYQFKAEMLQELVREQLKQSGLLFDS